MAIPQEALFELAKRYAAGADRRDGELYASAFARDGRLLVRRGEGAEMHLHPIVGHDDLRQVPGRLDRYARTFHVLGQATYGEDADGVFGEVYCIAHHLTVRESGAENYVMYIRYQDRYVTEDGEWRIGERRLALDWTETRPAHEPPPI